MLEEVTTVESRQDVAMTLVKIYLGQGLVVPFLDYLNTREVNQTSKMDGRMSFIEMILCLQPELLHNHLKQAPPVGNTWSNLGWHDVEGVSKAMGSINLSIKLYL